MRVLREMIVEEDASMQQVLHYLNYMIQVACFAQTKPWKRVFNYDTVYRREQHQHGFAWGSGSAFLMQSQLSPPEITNYQPPNNQTGGNNYKKPAGKRQVVHPTTGKPICGLWNGKNGCNLQVCEYEHVCKLCYSREHNMFHHQGSQSQPKDGDHDKVHHQGYQYQPKN